LNWHPDVGFVNYIMPRSLFDFEKRWLQKFEDAALRTRVFTISQGIWEKRAIMPYPDVIRARIMIMALNPQPESVRDIMGFSKKLEITEGILWNYFTRDVSGWADRMEQRLGIKAEDIETKPKRVPLTQDDLVWIGEFLSQYSEDESWTKKMKLLRGKALHDEKFRHLSRLPRSTLWDHRFELGAYARFGEEAREKCVPKKWRPSSIVRERDKKIVLQEFIEPEAVVISLTPVQPKEEAQWTGNPF
jgi:hypothetical protein